MVDPKGPSSGPNFWSGLETPDPLAPARRPLPFSHLKYNFFQNHDLSPMEFEFGFLDIYSVYNYSRDIILIIIIIVNFFYNVIKIYIKKVS